MRYEFIDGVTVVHLEKKKKKSNTGYVGIHRRKNGTYQVCKGKYMLGWRNNLDEAVSLRAEADRRKKDGTFDSWMAELLSKRK